MFIVQSDVASICSTNPAALDVVSRSQSAVGSVTEKVVAESAISPEGVTFEPDQLFTSAPNTCVCLTSWTV